ncbi:hypothetical protein Tco_1448308 [Tanacetum coccineum]
MVEPEEPKKKKDQIRLDEELAFKLQAKKEEEERLAREKLKPIKEESTLQQKEQRKRGTDHQQKLKREKLFDKEMKRVNIFVDMDTELVEENTKKAEAEIAQESSSKRAGNELEQERIKKQKMDDDKETTEVQSLMKIVPDEEEVAIDAIPLATKPPSIVDWKIIKEGKISNFQIIRADGSSKRYSAFIQMLKSFDREDLETLWKLVKAKHGYTRPEEGRIVGIKRLHDDLEVTAAKVRVTAAKQNLVLFSNLNEKYVKLSAVQ